MLVSSQHIDNHNWYYEEPEGVVLVHQVLTEHGAYVRTDTITIPWKMLYRSTARKKKKRVPR